MLESFFTENVMRELTPEERLYKGEELAQLMLQLDQLDEKKKRQNDEIKTEASEVDDKARDLARQLREGKIWADVECFESPDYAAGQVNIVSREDGRIVRVRTMRPEERQQGIKYEDGTSCSPPETPQSRQLKASNPKHDRAKSPKSPDVDSDDESTDDDDDSDDFSKGLQ
jgi:hypothetical protein